MKLLKSVSERYSPRAFSDKPVEKEKIGAMFEAARWAPSAFNGQPWRFIYADRENKETWDKLFDALIGFNQSWVKTAPLLILTVARKTFEHNGKPYRHNWHDVGLAVGNMMNQVTEMGLMMHQMSGFNAKKAAKNIHLPDEYEPVTMIAVGYKGDPAVLPPDLQEMENRERHRKNLSEIVFTKELP
ncbi:MAG: nitroreductase family protein [Bacteroidota bacterium]